MPERTNLRVIPHVSLSLAGFTLDTGCSPYLSAYGLACSGQAHSGARKQPVATDGAFRMNGHRLRQFETDGEHLRDVRRVATTLSTRRAPDNDVATFHVGPIERRQPLPRLSHCRLVAVGMLSANAVSFFRNPFSSAGRPQGSIGRSASVRAWRASHSRTDPRMFLPVCWRQPERFDGLLQPHSGRPE